MQQIQKPSHPGRLLAHYLADRSVTEVARHLGVARPTLSRLLHGRTAVSLDMALRLAAAFKTEPDLWLRLQMQYDLWRASSSRRAKASRARIKPIQPLVPVTVL